jgi:hypothetical protein
MFDAEELKRVVGLQQKSYKLLQWVGDALNSGTLHFNVVHQALSLSDAATEWVERNWSSLPAEMRPDREDIPPFAHLFASYLTTSFNLLGQPGMRRESSCGCYCDFCAYLVAAPYLHVRNPDKKARERARQMKELYLSGLAKSLGVSVPYAVIEGLLADATLAEDIAYAAYAQELMRRSQFASQGEGVLVLWREIAWDPRGKPKKGFTLSAERALQAEAKIAERLRQTPMPSA